MQFYILGVSVFFFASAIALSIWSCRILNRAIDVLHYSLLLLDDLRGAKSNKTTQTVWNRIPKNES